MRAVFSLSRKLRPVVSRGLVCSSRTLSSPFTTLTQKRYFSTASDSKPAAPSTPPPPPPPPSGPPPPPPPPQDFTIYNHVPKVAPKRLIDKMRMGQEVYILDVRPLEEFNKIHIKGAGSAPYENIREISPRINKEMPIFLYGNKVKGMELQCKTQIILSELGFESYVLLGGVEDLINAGFAYESQQDII
eukprot:TRINITY_DN1098_c0_g2_i4.p1 TRINITY_DN1098_c0_g2~~TRINITY_DN1098_c0_g2_i4.p1  ORF type:complete len:189 (-),score=52.26 TRINITY_DN1098_c0_g2_i4:30-596(-)